MSKKLPENVIELLHYINDTPALLSLLYDIDMLPEQLTEQTKPWGDMLIIAAHFRAHDRLIRDSFKAPSKPISQAVYDEVKRNVAHLSDI